MQGCFDEKRRVHSKPRVPMEEKASPGQFQSFELEQQVVKWHTAAVVVPYPGSLPSPPRAWQWNDSGGVLQYFDSALL